MPLKSFETSPSAFAIDHGPLLQYAPQGGDAAEQCLRIRARRVFPVSRNELFAAWTTRAEMESWLGFRTHSRAVMKPYVGSAFRLELAEGPIIHVITGTAMAIRIGEFVSFTWIHHDRGDYGSTIDVAFGQQRDQSELCLVHHSIESRREAAWLMRLWAAALDRLDRYFVTSGAAARRASSAA